MSDTPSETAQRVTVALAGGVADVRLNRPEKRNALDPAMSAALAAEQEEMHALIGSPNQVEAVTARFEKRDPVFGEA
jgi:enoyl-CoA hydratase/carnithine racemase